MSYGGIDEHVAEAIVNSIEASPRVARNQGVWSRVRQNLSARIGAVLILLIALMGAGAPLLCGWDPNSINPGARNKPPGYRDDNSRRRRQ